MLLGLVCEICYMITTYSSGAHPDEAHWQVLAHLSGDDPALELVRQVAQNLQRIVVRVAMEAQAQNS